jgi:serine O-acetyltransferase
MNFEKLILGREAHARPLRTGDANENPEGMSLRDLLAEDLQTHGGHWLAPGFLALAVHRFGNWRMSIRSAVVRAPLTAAYRVAYRASTTLWGIDLPYVSKIGRRVRIDHHGAVYVGAWAIGDDVVIRHSVTIGLVRRNTTRAPIIGSRVELGPGACVVGEICVGNDCYVGPNTVLAESLPDGAAAIGVPARQVKKEDLLGPG